MSTPSSELEAAILYLVAERDPTYIRSMLDSIEQWSRVAPVRFTEHLAVLNPIVDAMANNPVEFARIAALVDTRRDLAGLPWVWPPSEPEKINRRAQQRRLNQMRRDRASRAVRLENATRREEQKLRGAARLQFEERVLRKWAKDLDNRIADARARAGGALTQGALHQIRSKFWAEIDADMDAAAEALRKEGKFI